jgi:hypothetical protein
VVVAVVVAVVVVSNLGSSNCNKFLIEGEEGLEVVAVVVVVVVESSKPNFLESSSRTSLNLSSSIDRTTA